MINSEIAWRPEGARVRQIRRRITLALLLATASAAMAPPHASSGQAAAQAPGFAEISAPATGQSLQGMVTITGSASHPAFVSYDLMFGYANDLTQTWFPIAEAVTTPVVDGPLALWDTRTISDETFQVRLMVLLDDGTHLEATVTGLQVHNYTPTQVPVAASGRPAPTTASPVAATLPTAALPPPAPASRSPEDVVQSYLRLGIGAGVAAMIALGLLVLSRRAWRWGQAAMPRRRARRSRRRRSSGE